MKTAALSVIVLSTALSSAANADARSALVEFGRTLRQVRSLPADSTVAIKCPRNLQEMIGISKAAVFAELQSPDMEEKAVSRDAELSVFMHYHLRPRRPTDSVESFRVVTFELSSTYVVRAVSCI